MLFQLNLSYNNILNNLNSYDKEVKTEEERRLIDVYRCNTMKEYEIVCTEYNMMNIAKEECDKPSLKENLKKRWNKDKENLKEWYGKEEVQKNMKVEFVD